MILTPRQQQVVSDDPPPEYSEDKQVPAVVPVMSESSASAVTEGQISINAFFKKRSPSPPKQHLTPPQPSTKPEIADIAILLSAPLCSFLCISNGSKLPKAAVLAIIYKYIETHNLQKSDNKTIIIPDEKLKELFFMDDGMELTYSNLQEFVNIHFLNTEEPSAPAKPIQSTSAVESKKKTDKPRPNGVQGCRDMAKCFTDGQRIRHKIGTDKIWVGSYDASKNGIMYDGKVLTLHKFVLNHYAAEKPERLTANAWKECECEVGGQWVSTHSLPAIV